MARRKRPQTAGETLTRWVKRHKLESGFRRHELALRWRQFVGDRVATRTQPRELQNGVLTVEVSSSAWLNELSFLRESLRGQINRGLGSQRVAQIRFVLRAGAGSDTPRAPVVAASSPPGPAQRAAAQTRAGADIPRMPDDELRQSIMHAREAQLLRERLVRKPKEDG
jgi:predicted nucleic acid-binding Zn ribbon protein